MTTWYETLAAALAETLGPSSRIDSPLAEEGDDVAILIGKSEGEFLVLDVLDPEQAALIVGYAFASGKQFLVSVPTQASHVFRDKNLNLYTTEENSGRIFGTTVKLVDVAGISPLTDDLDKVQAEYEEDQELTKSVEIVNVSKSDKSEERIVSGIVYEPDTLDAHGDFMTRESIRDMAFYYMEHGKVVGLQHNKDASRDVAILESYLTPFPGELEGRKIKEGTWMMSVRVNNAKIWAKIKSGAITGFSFGAAARVIQH